MQEAIHLPPRQNKSGTLDSVFGFKIRSVQCRSIKDAEKTLPQEKGFVGTAVGHESVDPKA